MGCIEFYWVLLDLPEFYRVLLGFIGFHLVLLVFTEIYLVLPNITGFHWVFTGFYRVLLGFTGFSRKKNWFLFWNGISLSFFGFVFESAKKKTQNNQWKRT